MAEVLSQSQIDALLNAVQTGEKDISQQQEEGQENKYRLYDFSSPRKFTKDRVKMLQSIYDNYARVINTRLNAVMRTNCEVEVESVEEQRYHEFSNALRESDVITLTDVMIKEEKHEIPMMIYLSTPIALSMMDRLMGGEGNTDDTLGSDYSYTEVEVQLYENIIQDLISVMGASWENYVDEVDFRYNKVDVNPTMNQITGLDETVVIVDMKMQFMNVDGSMRICLPGEVLMSIFGELNRENTARKVVSSEKKTEEIFGSIRDSQLEIVAELGSTQMLLSDIYHLNVGDVIDIGKSKDSEINLKIGGYDWFTGRMGTNKKNIAVKIESVYQME